MASVSGFVLITSIYEIYCAIPHVTWARNQWFW
jgi:hypothetical protein